MKFKSILVDPPWAASDPLTMGDTKRGADSHYGTMDIEAIKSLDIKSITDPNGSVLCLWVLGSMLQEGMDVMSAWGFTLKQTYVWVKSKKDLKKDLIKAVASEEPKLGDNILSFGLGRTFRQSHEICLIGINNTKLYKSLKNKSQRSVIIEPNAGHSQKPENLHKSLDLMFSSETDYKVEIFARRQFGTKWLCTGNESPMTFGEDIRDSISKLSNIDEETILKLQNSSSEIEKAAIWADVSLNKP